jgi:hypothetical protein
VYSGRSIGSLGAASSMGTKQGMGQEGSKMTFTKAVNGKTVPDDYCDACGKEVADI